MSALIAALCLAPATPGVAVHEGTNALAFAPVPGSPSPSAEGTGTVEFYGGTEPTTRWTATARFSGLRADTPYVVVLQGRAGADGSAEAAAFTPVCAFRSDGAGDGGCWEYVLGLRRLAVAQLRLGDEAGQPVLQATRGTGGPGSIVSVPNLHAPSPVASPTSGLPTVVPSTGG